MTRSPRAVAPDLCGTAARDGARMRRGAPYIGRGARWLLGADVSVS